MLSAAFAQRRTTVLITASWPSMATTRTALSNVERDDVPGALMRTVKARW